MSYDLVTKLLALSGPDALDTHLRTLSDEERFELAHFFRQRPERSGTFSGSGTAGYWEEAYRIPDVTYDRTLSLLRAMGERVDPYPSQSRLVADVIATRPVIRKGMVGIRLRIIAGELVPSAEVATPDGRRARIVRESFIPIADRVNGHGALLRLLDDRWRETPLVVGDRLIADAGS